MWYFKTETTNKYDNIDKPMFRTNMHFHTIIFHTMNTPLFSICSSYLALYASLHFLSCIADDTADDNNDGVEGATNNNGGTTNNNDDTGGGGIGGVYHPYYPDITSGKCFNDGRQSEFQVLLYDTLSDCVSFILLFFSFFLLVFV